MESEDVEVISVAPSLRAVCRIKRLVARAKGRPRLATRRAIAAVTKARRKLKFLGKRRRQSSGSVPPETMQLGVAKAELKAARSEIAMLSSQRSSLQASFALERQKSSDLQARVASQQKKLDEVTRSLGEVPPLEALKAKGELSKERRISQDLKTRLAHQSDELKALKKEQTYLQRLVQELKREKVNAASSSGTLRLDAKAFARQVAEMECQFLSSCSTDDKFAVQRKLLLKWHPDKQPSREHAAIATTVVQEMQNCGAWKHK